MSVFNRLCCIKDDTTQINKVLSELDTINIMQSDNLCGICISPLENKTCIAELKNKCAHEFCQTCVVNMVKYCKRKKIKLRCPLCRNE